MFLVADLTRVANAFWLPWLIKGLKQKHIEAPAKRTADAFLEESFRVGVTGFCYTIIGTSYIRKLGLAQSEKTEDCGTDLFRTSQSLHSRVRYQRLFQQCLQCEQKLASNRPDMLQSHCRYPDPARRRMHSQA